MTSVCLEWSNKISHKCYIFSPVNSITQNKESHIKQVHLSFAFWVVLSHLMGFWDAWILACWCRSQHTNTEIPQGRQLSRLPLKTDCLRISPNLSHFRTSLVVLLQPHWGSNVWQELWRKSLQLLVSNDLNMFPQFLKCFWSRCVQMIWTQSDDRTEPLSNEHPLKLAQTID